MDNRYATRFGTDWSSLSMDEALRRAYALGVASTIGEAPDGERERLFDAVSSSHYRHLVDLAFQEGRARAKGLEVDPWDELVVEADFEGARRSEVIAQRTSLPLKRNQLKLLEQPTADSREMLRFPQFLW